MANPKAYVRIDTNMPEVLNTIDIRVDEALRQMARDIVLEARIKAPHLTGKLKSSGRYRRRRFGAYDVSFGNAGVRYAYVRHEQNQKNPHTRFYLKNASEYVNRNIDRYLRGIL